MKYMFRVSLFAMGILAAAAGVLRYADMIEEPIFLREEIYPLDENAEAGFSIDGTVRITYAADASDFRNIGWVEFGEGDFTCMGYVSQSENFPYDNGTQKNYTEYRIGPAGKYSLRQVDINYSCSADYKEHLQEMLTLVKIGYSQRDFQQVDFTSGKQLRRPVEEMTEEELISCLKKWGD